jgi:16S rRNA (guanine966-N2)-methyltransferase
VRVISGSAKGRPLKAPPGLSTRPMTDRLKISLFDTLAPYGFEGARVLDLFAGSGSLGIEMLSRGAEWCDFVEQSPSVCGIIRDNLRSTGLAGRAHVYKMFVARYLTMRAGAVLGHADDEGKDEPQREAETLALDMRSLYDIILLDPPYADPEIERTLETVARSPIVSDDGLVVIGHRKGVLLADEYGGGRIGRVRHRAMGDSAFSIYEVIAEREKGETDSESGL